MLPRFFRHFSKKFLKCPSAVTFRGHLGFTMTLSAKARRRRNGTDPDIDFESGAADRPARCPCAGVPAMAAPAHPLDVALTALCDVLLFWDELFYYESFGLFAVLILVQLAATGAAAFRIYNKQRKG